MYRVFLAVTLFTIAVAGRATEVNPGEDLRSAINALRPGDLLELTAGTYALNGSFRVTVNGTISSPIIVRPKSGQHALIHQSDPSSNIIEISNSAYLIVDGLEFSGGSHGVRLMNSSFITIQNCEIHDTGDVALSANSGGTYEGLQILRNHIHHTNGTGEGMYLGCNSDACRVANSLVEGNYIHNTNGPTVEQGDGIELKEGSYGNVIRDNVIHDTNYPGIITYSTVGNGPANVIEGNLIWNTNDNGIQSAADAIIRNNIVIGAPIALQAHQAGSPSNQRIVHNTIVTTGGGINVRNVVGPVVIANNAVYSQTGAGIRLISGNLALVTMAGNIDNRGQQVSADFVDGHYGGGPPIDLFPALAGALVGAGAAAYVEDIDFNGTRRDGVADAGAYAFASSGNPGWRLAAGFKNSNRPAAPQNLRVQ